MEALTAAAQGQMAIIAAHLNARAHLNVSVIVHDLDTHVRDRLTGLRFLRPWDHPQHVGRRPNPILPDTRS